MLNIKRKPLSHHSNKELQKYLDENDSQNLSELAGICSEILRRINWEKLLKETRQNEK